MLRLPRRLLATVLLLEGCVFITTSDRRAREDADGDGVSVLDDCDDSRASVAPGLPEQCDGLDNDCDGEIDEDLWPDADGDGHGGAAEGPCAVDWIDVAGDCDDADPEVFPGQFERCNGRDDGCRSGWTPEHELGVVTWEGPDGTLEDRSDALPADQRDEPATVSPGPAGTLHICRAAAPYRVRITADDVDDLRIVGHAIPLPDDPSPADAWPVLSGASASTPAPTVRLSGLGGRVELSGLTVSGGFTTPTLPGGGVHLSQLTTAWLSGLSIVGNQAVSGSAGGAGLYAGNIVDLQLAQVELAHNLGVDGTTGGGALIETTNARLVEVDIVDNRAATGGGLAFTGADARLDVRDSTLADNWGNRKGGGLHVGPEARAFLVGTSIHDNQSALGGGAHVEGRLTCFGDEDGLPSTWARNTADACGGTAVLAGFAALSFDGCTAEEATVAASSAELPCLEAQDIGVYESTESRSPRSTHAIVGDWFFCDWERCQGEIE